MGLTRPNEMAQLLSVLTQRQGRAEQSICERMSREYRWQGRRKLAHAGVDITSATPSVIFANVETANELRRGSVVVALYLVARAEVVLSIGIVERLLKWGVNPSPVHPVPLGFRDAVENHAPDAPVLK